MRWDFWNNPIVVSALRVNYRRSHPGWIASLHVLFLMTGLMAARYYEAAFAPTPWHRVFLVGLLGLQTVISAFLALAGTGSSIHSEVANHTLDFQKIVSMSPREILIGKLLGDPAIAYLLVMVSFPFAVLCSLFGELSLGEVVLLHLNVFTSVVAFAAIGLVHPLRLREGQRTASSSSGMGIPMAFLLMLVGGWAIVTPAVPLSSFAENGDLWIAASFYGAPIPVILLAPVLQLLLTASVVGAMARRMMRPTRPLLTKQFAYTGVVLFDVGAAGMCFEIGASMDPVAAVAAFLSAHLAVSLALAVGVTPQREEVVVGIWRSHRARPSLRHLLLHESTEIGWVVFLLAIVGPVASLLLLLLPLSFSTGLPAFGQLVHTILPLVIVGVVVLLASGSLLQVVALCVERAWFIVVAVVAGFLVMWPIVAIEALEEYRQGTALPIEELAQSLGSLTPVHHFAQALGPRSRDAVPLLPIVVEYGVIFVAGRLWLRRWSRNRMREVELKLALMKVRQPSPTAGVQSKDEG